MRMNGRAGTGFYTKQADGEPVISCPIAAKSAAQEHRQWDRLHHGKEGEKYKYGISKNNPNPYRISAWDRLLPPHMGCQLCQSTLGIVRDFRLFLGGGSSSSMKLLVRDKEHHVK